MTPEEKIDLLLQKFEKLLATLDEILEYPEDDEDYGPDHE